MKNPFTIQIEDNVISDLKQRLANTRWPDEYENSDWEYGVNSDYMKQLCDYWLNGYDWRKQESYLNSFDHFIEDVNDIDIHLIYRRSGNKNAIPLLLIHGWPDSIARYLKIIPELTKTENGISFDVIVPSIPGFGFSGKPTESGMNPQKIAGIFAKLMTDVLGYEKFMVHGGDWGSTIAESMALYHPGSLYALHLTDVPTHHMFMPVENQTEAEAKYLKKREQWLESKGGYYREQSTKPQTLGHGLNDSPAGLAAWIIEKFRSWTDNDGNPEDALSKDELLTNVMIYWVTQSITSSVRIYFEAMEALKKSQTVIGKLNPMDKTGGKTEVQTAFALLPKDISSPPKEFAERFFNVQRWTKFEKGGHFTAMEIPNELAVDIRDFASEIPEMNQPQHLLSESPTEK